MRVSALLSIAGNKRNVPQERHDEVFRASGLRAVTIYTKFTQLHQRIHPSAYRYVGQEHLDAGTAPFGVILVRDYSANKKLAVLA